MEPQPRLLLSSALSLFVLLLVACSPTPARPKVTIESPFDGTTVHSGDMITVKTTVSDPRGIAWVELWVDGHPVGGRYVPNTSATSFTQYLLWTDDSTDSRMRIIKVVAENQASADGESRPIGLHVLGGSGAVQVTAPTFQSAASPNPAAVPAPVRTLPPTPVPRLAPCPSLPNGQRQPPLPCPCPPRWQRQPLAPCSRLPRW